MSGDDVARSILDTVAYLVLATVDDDGLPWASPVWVATDGDDDLSWISAPDAQHSRNLAVFTRDAVGQGLAHCCADAMSARLSPSSTRA